MANSTSRLALPLPVGTDPPSELRTAISALSTAMDPSVLYYSGTLANRGTVVSSPLAGYLYYATDTTTLYEYNGSAWGVVMVAGAWVALSTFGLASGVISIGAGETASVRLVGDMVQFKGGLSASTGSVTQGSTILTLTSPYVPSAAVLPSATANNGGGYINAGLVITSAGVMKCLGTALTSGSGSLNLDGVSYSIS